MQTSRRRLITPRTGRVSDALGDRRGAHDDFVSYAGDSGHAAHVRLRARLLIGPFDNALQGNPAMVHTRANGVTRDCEIPMKSMYDLGANIHHGAGALP